MAKEELRSLFHTSVEARCDSGAQNAEMEPSKS